MKTIWKLFVGDVRRLTSNVVSIIIVIGLVVIPALFTWFNVAACWDPFANTKNLKFAIANEDEGYSSDLLPIKVSIGDDIVNSLRANSDLDWTFTSKDAAIEGTKSGTYYAAVVIPADFSKTMMTFLSSDAEHATLDYYDNEKLNALAPKVTGQGADTIAAEINEMFAKTITDSALSIANALIENLEKPQAQTTLAKFNSNVSDLASALTDSGTALSAYAGLTDSAKTLLDSSTALVKNADSSAKGAVEELKTAKSSVSDLTGALDTSVDALSSALTASATAFGSVSTQLDTLFDNVDKSANDAASSITDMATTISTQASDYQKLRDSLAALEPDLSDTAKAALEAVLARLDSLIALQRTLASDLNDAAKKISSKVSDADEDRESIKNLASQAKNAVDGISNDFNTSVKPDLTAMNEQFTDAASQLGSAVADLKDSFGDLSDTASDVDSGLTKAQQVIADASDSLTQAGTKLSDFQKKLAAALDSGDMAQVKKILSSDSTSLAETLAAPVKLETKAVFPVENFGTALTPFYSFLALWVGSLLLAVTLKTTVSRKTRAELGDPKPHQLYLGHYGVFLLIALLQSTFMQLGLLLFLRVKMVHPLLFLVDGWGSAFVYSLFIYTLVVSFSNVGKAIGVLFLVMQITGSDGAYPLAVLPKITQEISPLLPMTYSVKAARAAIAGIYQNDFWGSIGGLLLFVPPVLLIGLLLRKPLVGFNRWYSAKVESTKLLG